MHAYYAFRLDFNKEIPLMSSLSGIFSFCDGWGYNVQGGDCSFIRASITINMWTDLSATETYSYTEVHQTGETGGVHEFSLFPTYSIDVDNDIITAAVSKVYFFSNAIFAPVTACFTRQNTNFMNMKDGLVFTY